LLQQLNLWQHFSCISATVKGTDASELKTIALGLMQRPSNATPEKVLH